MKKKYSLFYLLLLFSFLYMLVNYDTKAIIDDNDGSNYDQDLEKITPVVTIDLSKCKDNLFMGTINDENFDLGYSKVKVNNETGTYLSYVNDSAKNFIVDTFYKFSSTANVTNNVTIEARSLIPSSSPYYHLSNNGLGPLVIVTSFFCDNRECWSGGPLPLSVKDNSDSRSSDLTSINEAPFLNLYLKDYCEDREIKYNTTDPSDYLEPEDKRKTKEAYYIKVTGTDGFITYVKLVGIKSKTEIKPTTAIPIHFDSIIYGILLSTVAIVFIRKRKKK